MAHTHTHTHCCTTHTHTHTHTHRAQQILATGLMAHTLSLSDTHTQTHTNTHTHTCTELHRFSQLVFDFSNTCNWEAFDSTIATLVGYATKQVSFTYKRALYDCKETCKRDLYECKATQLVFADK